MALPTTTVKFYLRLENNTKCTTKMFTQRSQSSSGRQIRPTPKMRQMMSELTKGQGRKLGAEAAEQLHRSTDSPLPTPRTRMDVDTLLEMQRQIEEEIKLTELNISQREAQLRRSSSSRKSQSPRMAPTPEGASTSGETDIDFKVLDSTGPNEAAGTYTQVHNQRDQIVTYRRNQISLPENGHIMREHYCQDQAIVLNKAAPEFYPPQTQMWYAAQEAPPPKRCPELDERMWYEAVAKTSGHKEYNNYDSTTTPQNQQVQNAYLRNDVAAQQAQYPYDPAPNHAREREAQQPSNRWGQSNYMRGGTMATRSQPGWPEDENGRSQGKVPQGELQRTQDEGFIDGARTQRPQFQQPHAQFQGNQFEDFTDGATGQQSQFHDEQSLYCGGFQQQRRVNQVGYTTDRGASTCMQQAPPGWSEGLPSRDSRQQTARRCITPPARQAGQLTDRQTRQATQNGARSIRR